MASLKNLITLFLSLGCLLSLGQSGNTKPITIKLVNKCTEAVFPAFRNVTNTDNPYRGGLQPGGDQYDVQVDIYQGRIWPRTGCVLSPTGLKCKTGDCGGERCTAEGIGDYTFAELIHTSSDHVNLGLKYKNQVNIPMEFKPANTYGEQHCKTLTCIQTGCGNNTLSGACKIPNSFLLTFCPNNGVEYDSIHTSVLEDN
ncbi:hypothetical protein LUZ62_043555 [Rhynchospora pubera]|uniref:Thaumatin-like protein n=1 Tax=Rhynchospora pubera TaxID=906938 RepID=A0AAV8FKV8_9POAL|nr:hypothetical protein LUZ62_043555 [Rhynchospora pubera]